MSRYHSGIPFGCCIHYCPVSGRLLTPKFPGSPALRFSGSPTLPDANAAIGYINLTRFPPRLRLANSGTLYGPKCQLPDIASCPGFSCCPDRLCRLHCGRPHQWLMCYPLVWLDSLNSSFHLRKPQNSCNTCLPRVQYCDDFEAELVEFILLVFLVF